MIYEDVMVECIMVKTMNFIENMVWVYVVEDLPNIINQLKFYLEFDTMHKKNKNFLKYGKEVVQQKNRVVGIIRDIINIIPMNDLELFGINDWTSISMDVDNYTNKHNI